MRIYQIFNFTVHNFKVAAAIAVGMDSGRNSLKSSSNIYKEFVDTSHFRYGHGKCVYQSMSKNCLTLKRYQVLDLCSTRPDLLINQE